MKAMILKTLNRPLAPEEIPIPEPGPDEVLIKVMACGCDATDWKILDGFAYVPTLPIILGHETTGLIAGVGTNVEEFSIGDRVVAYNYFYCGKCDYCCVHREQLCTRMAGLVGILNRNGGYAEYVTVLARQAVRVPENVHWPDAAVCCDAGITAVHAVDRADVRLGETVLVIGVGGVGAVTVQICKASGARVIAADLTPEKCEWALRMGADIALNSNETSISSVVRGLTNGKGVDCVLDVVGLEATVGSGMDSLRNGGRLVLVGYTKERYPLKGEQLDQHELTLIGTRGGRLLDLRNTVRYVAEGRIKSIVTNTFPLEEANEALAFVKSGKALGRTVLLTPEGRKAMKD